MLLRLVLFLALSALPQSGADPARAGWEAIQRGDGEKAASAFRAVLADNPRDPNALAGAGIAAHILGSDDKAIAFLKKALEARPDFAYAAFLLGQVAYSQGDLDLAIASYERAIKIAPGNAQVYKQLQDWKKEAELHDTFASRNSVRFNVMFQGPAQKAIADRVSAGLDAAYMRVGAAMNEYPPETITAILYTQEQFRDITKSPSWAAGAYDGRIRIPVLGALKTPGELDRVVTHEYVHALIHSTTPRLPIWLNEGLATYFEPADHAWLVARLRAARTTIPLATLDESFSRLDGSDALLAYAESFVATRVLVRRLGAHLPVFLQYLSEGTAFDQALLLFNISVADVEREWSAQLVGR